MRKFVLAFSLLLSLSVSMTQNIFAQEYFDDETAFLYYLKLFNRSLEKFAVVYLHDFKRSLYDKYVNDEFEFDYKKIDTIKQLNEKLSKLNDTSKYFLNATFELGKYDFEKNAFDFAPLKKSTYLKVMAFSPDQTDQKTKNINITFDNPEIVTDIVMDKNMANEFIKQRKNDLGDVNRDVYAHIIFQVKGVSKDIDSALLGHINTAEIYSDSNLKNLIAAFNDTQKPSTSARESMTTALKELEDLLNSHKFPINLEKDIKSLIDRYKIK